MPKLIINYDSLSEDQEETKFDRFFNKKDVGFRTNNSNYFKSIMSYISLITENVNIRLCSDGIRFMSLDNSHVALVNSFIPLSFFKVFNMIDHREIVIGLNLVQFMKILNHINHSDELVIKYMEDYINISFISKKYQKHYTLKLLSIDSEEMTITPLENPTKISMVSKYFSDIINDFNDVGESVVFKITKKNEFDEHISFICSGDMTELNMVLYNEDLIISNLQDLNMEFNLKNLQIFSKGYNLNKDMSIEIVDGNPIKLSYTIMKEGYIDYYIAPKFDDDDEE